MLKCFQFHLFPNLWNFSIRNNRYLMKKWTKFVEIPITISNRINGLFELGQSYVQVFAPVYWISHCPRRNSSSQTTDGSLSITTIKRVRCIRGQHFSRQQHSNSIVNKRKDRESSGKCFVLVRHSKQNYCVQSRVCVGFRRNSRLKICVPPKSRCTDRVSCCALKIMRREEKKKSNSYRMVRNNANIHRTSNNGMKFSCLGQERRINFNEARSFCFSFRRSRFSVN